MRRAAGIVLAGGHSSRMGVPKASLEWHGSTLLRRVAGILARSLDGPVVIVGAPGRTLPRLPAGFEVLEDRRADRGPLEGLATGLNALSGRAETAFAAATDAPLLHPAFVAAVVAGLGAEDDVCVPVLDGVAQPLAAAYRVGVASAAAKLLAGDRLSLGLLLEGCRVRRLDAVDLLADDRLAGADPHLESLLNLNDPAGYAAARGRPAPEIRVLFRGGLPGAAPDGGASRIARAATLAQAAAAAGVAIGDGILGRVNGGPASEDPELPLVGGDRVVLARGGPVAGGPPQP